MQTPDLVPLAAFLRSQGWDVVADEGEVIASRQDRGGSWTLSIDGSARLLFTAVQLMAPARSRRRQSGRLNYRTLWEEHGVFTLSTEVWSVDDLAQVLRDLPDLIHEARQEATRRARP